MNESVADISEMFEFLEETLVYADAPLEGLLRRRADGALFAFRCSQLVGDLVFHWTLLPVDSPNADISEAFAHGAETTWISILEDRRCLPPVLVAVELPAQRW
jgi:hypothetical protein